MHSGKRALLTHLRVATFFLGVGHENSPRFFLSRFCFGCLRRGRRPDCAAHKCKPAAVSNANGFERSDIVADALAHGHFRYPDAGTDGYIDTHPCAHRDTDTGAERYSDTDPGADGYTDTHPRAHRDTDTNPRANGYADTDPGAHRYADTDRLTNADRNGISNAGHSWITRRWKPDCQRLGAAVGAARRESLGNRICVRARLGHLRWTERPNIDLSHGDVAYQRGTRSTQ